MKYRLDVAVLLAAATFNAGLIIYVLAKPGALTAILGG